MARSGTLTTNGIAERAGVSIGTLYQYFENKRGVLNALFEVALVAERERWTAEPLRGPAGPLVLRLCAGLCAWWCEPVHRRLIEQLGETDLKTHRLWAVGMVVDHFQPLLCGHEDLRADRIQILTAGHGVVAALLYAVPRGALAPDVREQTARELALMVLGALSCPVTRWRAATQQTPRSLGAPSRWSLATSPRRAIRQWLRARPRQPRAQASVAAIITTAGHLLAQGADYTAERLAAGAGVSVGTVYRYFADKHFALGEYGVSLLARYTERMVDFSADAQAGPGRTVQRMVYLTLDPLRHNVALRLRTAMYTHGERRIIDAQLNQLSTLFAPIVQSHPLCGVDAAHLPWALHAIEGAAVWLTHVEGLQTEPLAFGTLVETCAQLAFTYLSADRPASWAVLSGEGPLSAVFKPPGPCL